jgi:hypothetical protein
VRRIAARGETRSSSQAGLKGELGSTSSAAREGRSTRSLARSKSTSPRGSIATLIPPFCASRSASSTRARLVSATPTVDFGRRNPSVLEPRIGQYALAVEVLAKCGARPVVPAFGSATTWRPLTGSRDPGTMPPSSEGGPKCTTSC